MVDIISLLHPNEPTLPPVALIGIIFLIALGSGIITAFLARFFKMYGRSYKNMDDPAYKGLNWFHLSSDERSQLGGWFGFHPYILSDALGGGTIAGLSLCMLLLLGGAIVLVHFPGSAVIVPYSTLTSILIGITLAGGLVGIPLSAAMSCLSLGG